MEHYISESIQPRCATPRVTLYMHYHHVCMSFCKPSPNLQEIFGDSLLSAPLDKAETELPSPERLKRRIVLKHKKLEAQFPLFARIYEIAFEGKDPKSIVEL